MIFDTQERRETALWHGRAVLAHRRAIGFDHLGHAQQTIFRHGNGFHSFDEPLDYEVIWSGALGVPLTTVELLVVPWPKPKEDRPSVAVAPKVKLLTIAQQEERLPDLYREVEPVAVQVVIKLSRPTAITPETAREKELWDHVRRAQAVIDLGSAGSNRDAYLDALEVKHWALALIKPLHDERFSEATRNSGSAHTEDR